jgi:hypothetical protein
MPCNGLDADYFAVAYIVGNRRVQFSCLPEANAKPGSNGYQCFWTAQVS